MEDSSAQITEHFFRHEASKLRVALTNVLGSQYMDLCEDVIQESIYRALSKWPISGLPPDPAGWIFKTARNIAIDHIRRDKLLQSKSTEIIKHLNQFDRPEIYRETQFKDNLLRMMFACCHPDLLKETQIIMTLKVLCSFHNKEIAAALLKKESAIEKAAGRGKHKMRDLLDPNAIDFEVDVDARLQNVLNVIYLMFSEGYKASTGPSLIKQSLILEAIRLTKLLCDHPKTDLPEVNALLALLLFNSARLNTRVSESGELLVLKQQNRSEWNQELIMEGQTFLNKSSEGSVLSEYHILAGISACHSFAPSFEQTDWNLILEFYDILLLQKNSPLYKLNRIVAVLYAKGPANAEKGLAELAKEKTVENYYLFYMVLAEVNVALGREGQAILELQKALNLATNEIEKKYIKARISAI